jgi:tagatose-1,6-bisphosphate aldolase
MAVGEHPADTRTTTDSAAVEVALADRGRQHRAAGAGNRMQDALEVPWLALCAAWASKLGSEAIVMLHGSALLSTRESPG